MTEYGSRSNRGTFGELYPCEESTEEGEDHEEANRQRHCPLHKEWGCVDLFRSALTLFTRTAGTKGCNTRIDYVARLGSSRLQQQRLTAGPLFLTQEGVCRWVCVRVCVCVCMSVCVCVCVHIHRHHKGYCSLQNGRGRRGGRGGYIDSQTSVQQTNTQKLSYDNLCLCIITRATHIHTHTHTHMHTHTHTHSYTHTHTHTHTGVRWIDYPRELDLRDTQQENG
jgi:hypothetical protein